MRSLIAALRTLVLPFGATSGARIILDGVSGRIQIFDINGNQLVVIDGTDGIRVYDSAGDQRMQLAIPSLTEASRIRFHVGGPDEITPANVKNDLTASTPNQRAEMSIYSSDIGDGAFGMKIYARETADAAHPTMVLFDAGDLVEALPVYFDFCCNFSGGNATGGIVAADDFWIGDNVGSGAQAPTKRQSLPRGVDNNGYAEITADSNTGTTIFDITGLSITPDLEAGRRYLITVGYEGMRSSVAGDDVRVSVRDSGGTVLGDNGRNDLILANSSQNGGTFSFVYDPSTDETNKQFKVSMARLTGTGNVGLGASTTSKAFILCQDIGEAV